MTTLRPQPAPSVLPIEVWFDFVCPFCYIGKRRLENVIAGLSNPVQVIYRSFQLSPEAPRQTHDNLNRLLQKRYGMSPTEASETNGRVAATAREFGLRLDFSAARWANTRDAHRLMKFAALHGKQDAMIETLYSAFFTKGMTIGEPATLHALAVQNGLPDSEVEVLFSGNAFDQDIAEDRTDGLRLGLHGVPFYRIGGALIPSEAISVDTLRRCSHEWVQNHGVQPDQCA